MSNPYDELAKVITGRAKAQKVPALVWATVKDVDWDAKEMTATGLTDGLDYYGVLLGIGGRYVKPAPGSKVLLGVIEGHAAHTVLMFAESVEEEIIRVGDAVVEIKGNKIKLANNGQNLKDILDELLDRLSQAIIQTPAGPGNFSPADVQGFMQIKTHVGQLLNQ